MVTPITLNTDQKIVVSTVKEFYETYDTHPSMRILIKTLETKKNWNKSKANSIYLHELFPENPIREASFHAGIPKPKKCL